ncbi:MAG: UDP-N-acetylglucosamine 2-epimerase (non-hydrolyzing) [Bdellovibrionota bacterium]|nr:UDP-N-acetylglucosamine 2-epimerase (non-hydrolyzing) [Bdellovibrionota bacterium]MEC8624741.1 UDP-N-acetylglucosamine 2-epimerase (non-hydrolyzing) [Bdellovibrionota bacterium]
MKIATVVGARPQFIKAAVLSRKLKSPEYAHIQEYIIHTGQHFDANMSKVFFEELNIPEPYANLGINGGSHGYQTGQMMTKLEECFDELKPDAVLVYGDTNSTIAASLVASKSAIPLIHIEAGLRSFRPGMPEEVNRIVTDRLSQFLFCPNDDSVAQLKKEGLTNHVYNVGDIMFEGFLEYIESTSYEKTLEENQLEKEQYVLMTLHRQENTDNQERFRFLIELAIEISRIKPIAFLLHPRTKNVLKNLEITLPETIKVIEPQPYKTNVGLIHNASLVLTDSGGLQKEAYFAKTPCITMRDETEWKESVEAGWNKLIHNTVKENLEVANHFINDFDKSSYVENLYGDGQSAKKILDIISQNL